ncbi:MAG: ABC transporter ATP-binding protein [Planctomycetota bacterium]|nr:ABC transporter ATP-binding protein [Planctomycetota bacterium]
MLRLTDVRKSYGEIIAVEKLSLEIKQGEIFGLLGPNGAGKSTCVSLSVGLLDCEEGSVDFNGAGSPTVPAVRAKIGVAPQALALYEELTGEENLRFFGSLQDLKGSRLNERVDWALQFVGLADRSTDRVKTYSGGMKRRLNIAAALLHDPELLLLDEPTVGVDPQSRNAILENILALKAKGRTIVYTTHYMEEVQKLCDRVGIIDYGKLLALDTVDELIRKHGGKNVVFAKSESGEVRIETDDPVEELSRLHAEGGLSEFRWEKPDLETVFLNLTGRSLRDQ